MYELRQLNMAQSEQAGAIPPTMKAWVRQHRGHYKSSFKLVDSLPTPPIPGPDSSDVIIQISYASLEFSIIHALAVLPVIPFVPPVIPEISVSGTIAAAGGRAPEGLQKLGTRVVAASNPLGMLFCGGGALKEYTRLTESQVVPLETQGISEDDAGERQALSMAQGAALVSNGSAANALARAAKVSSGQRVLLNGASGSVGHIAVQLCRARGAFVVGIASGANEALVRGCGAHEFVDYTKHTSLPDYLASAYGTQPFDCILDCVGSQTLYTNSPSYLRPGCPFVNIGAMDVEKGIMGYAFQWFMNKWRPVWLGGVPRPFIFFSNFPEMPVVLTLIEMAEQGKLKVLVDSEFAMEDLMQAYERVESKRTRGKVLLRIHDEEYHGETCTTERKLFTQ